MRFIASQLRRLLRDQSGNVIYITAALMFPLIALIGSGIDIGKAYMLKGRLQQACDAGVLAGRRAMAGGEYTAEAQTAANNMFSINYPAGLLDSRETTFRSARKGTVEVAGDASVVMPTTIMGIFGTSEIPISAHCAARMAAANTDIMMILDTTGSMADRNSGESVTKLQALQDAVMKFYDTVIEADTDDNRIRFGFVPYSSNVNVGKLVYAANSTYFSNSITVPSREYITSGSNNGKYYYTTKTYTVTSALSTSENSQNSTVSYPVGPLGSNVAASWDGCILERNTVAYTSSTVPWNAYDMDINLIPTSDEATKWHASLPEFVFQRGEAEPAGNDSAYPRSPTYTSSPNLNANYYSTADYMSFNHGDMRGRGFYACPSAARKLAEIPVSNRSTLQNYVNGLIAVGGTYHDVGMIWGTRFISPRSIFASENVDPSNGLQLSRHIIFMTDGAMAPNSAVYGFQGYENVMHRVGSTNSTTLTTLHTQRFQAACTAAKAMNITVWVVSFGTTLTDQMRQCASNGNAYQANSAAELNTRFQQIASAIARLRLTE